MAASIARRVFPAPPTPVSVNMRQSESCSRARIFSNSRSRPTRLVAGWGILTRGRGRVDAGALSSGLAGAPGAGGGLTRGSARTACSGGGAGVSSRAGGRRSSESSPRATRTNTPTSSGFTCRPFANNAATCRDGRRSSDSIFLIAAAEQSTCRASCSCVKSNDLRRALTHCPKVTRVSIVTFCTLSGCPGDNPISIVHKMYLFLYIFQLPKDLLKSV